MQSGSNINSMNEKKKSFLTFEGKPNDERKRVRTGENERENEERKKEKKRKKGKERKKERKEV
jgi:hypothetical protein